jgi:hypothetical protein
MTLPEAIATHSPAWVGLWLNVLLFGAFILPLALFIWKQTRLTALITLIASILGGVGVQLLYNQMGYVKLLGLPHIIVWTPLAIYLWGMLKTDLPQIPKVIIWIILVTIAISLAFDYVDVARYILGHRRAPTSPQ